MSFALFPVQVSLAPLFASFGVGATAVIPAAGSISEPATANCYEDLSSNGVFLQPGAPFGYIKVSTPGNYTCLLSGYFTALNVGDQINYEIFADGSDALGNNNTTSGQSSGPQPLVLATPKAAAVGQIVPIIFQWDAIMYGVGNLYPSMLGPVGTSYAINCFTMVRVS